MHGTSWEIIPVSLIAHDAAVQSTDPAGTRSFDPRMMLALLLFRYCRGAYSSRRFERAARLCEAG